MAETTAFMGLGNMGLPMATDLVKAGHAVREFHVMPVATGQCWSLTTDCPVPASPSNNGYKPGFAATLMVKDLLLSQEAAATALGNRLWLKV